MGTQKESYFPTHTLEKRNTPFLEDLHKGQGGQVVGKNFKNMHVPCAHHCGMLHVFLPSYISISSI